MAAFERAESGVTPAASAPSKAKRAKDTPPKVGMLDLLQFATWLDWLYIVLAIPFAMLTGFLQVSFLFIFGPLMDSLGTTQAAGAFAPVSWGPCCGISMPLWFWFVFFGASQWATCFLYNYLADMAKERMILKYKTTYLKAIVRQDVGWYDTNNPQELSTRIGEGLKLIEEAISAKAVIVFEWLAMGITGFVLCFSFEWRVALIIMACSPLIFVAGAIMNWAQQNGQKKIQDAYAEAGGIASEVLSAVRTVASLGLEAKSWSRYDGALAKAESAGIRVAVLVTVGMAMLFSSPNVMMGAGLMYGTSLLSWTRKELSTPHRFNVRANLDLVPEIAATGVYDTTVEYCANDCDPYDFRNINASASLGLFYHNLDPANEPKTCAQLYEGTETFTWTCQTASLVVDNGFFDADTWTAFSFSQPGQQPVLTFTDVEGAPAVLGDETFKSYFEEQTGGWACLVAPSAILLAIFALQNGAQGLGNVGGPMNIMLKGRRAAVNILKTINRVPEIDSFSQEGRKLDVVKGAIEVRDVVFAYPASPDHNICNGYSLSIAAGQMVALCGPSGAGKSTLIALLERFYDPAAGSIELDGVNIKHLNLRWLRSRIGLVGQEPVLFVGTVAENIAYGKPEGATQDEIEEAARAANAHSFITNNLPDGYRTEVGQGGSKLSGGQKQRVAIARAIIKQPAVLLLDEATSALDTAGERVVQAALDEIMERTKRTTIAIAHRLSTIKHADKIAVIHQGRIVEEGTFDELLAIGEGGLFHSLAKAQDAGKGRASSVSYGANLEEMGSEDEAAGAGQGGVVELTEKQKKAAAKAGRPKAPKRVVRRLMSYQDKGDGRWFAAGFVGMFIAAAVWPCMGVLFSRMLIIPFTVNPDQVAAQGVWPWGILLVCSFVLLVAAALIEGAGFGIAGEHLTRNLRAGSVKKWLTMEIGFFDEEVNSAGELTQFLGESVTLIQSMNGEKLASAGRFLCVLTWGLALMFIFGDPLVCLVVLAALPVMGVSMSLQIILFSGGAVGDHAAGDEPGSGADGKRVKTAGALIGEVVLGIRTVASFTAEHKFYEDYCKVVTAASMRARRRNLPVAFLTGFSKGAVTMLFGAIFEFGMWRINSQTGDTIGGSAANTTTDSCASPLSFSAADGLFIPLMVMFMMAASLGGAASMATDAKKATAAASAFFKRTDRASLLDSSSADGRTLPLVRGAIQVRDVHFAYPTRRDFKICNGYSLTISAGQTVALCGPSGCGKSTLIALIERFYEPDAGSILFDGVDIRQLNVKWLRSRLGLVGQEPVLFMGTVAENIGYGKVDGVTREEIEEAARAANAHAFITEVLQDGYDTQVGIRGGKLSGGQKQRVAIARALVRKPDVLLLDEATSALDNESERVVQAALDEIMAKQRRTTITIAHRLSTIRNADLIAVINKGVVIEQGTHAELLSLEGTYTQLWEAQQ
jgi:ATP-binding cassette subfamily B (MDR/TAP) protein 1